MIISASRRTDIPAYYSRWFMNRIRAGFCHVPNPYNRTQVAEVSLAVGDVDAIFFMTKNPAPLLPNLKELDQLGYRYIFLCTLNAYPKFLEPRVPPLQERIATFQLLSERIGRERVIWRYDPIILSNLSDFDYHKQAFSHLVSQLTGYTSRVVISVIDFYRKTERRFGHLERPGLRFDRRPFENPEMPLFLTHLKQQAAEAGISIQSCAEDSAMAEAGIPPGACIDAALLHKLWGLPVIKHDPNQRKACACAIAKDIGVPNSCLHGCQYCYATDSDAAAQKSFAHHDPTSSVLIGSSPLQQDLNNQLPLF